MAEQVTQYVLERVELQRVNDPANFQMLCRVSLVFKSERGALVGKTLNFSEPFTLTKFADALVDLAAEIERAAK